jgi:hypothetical protein
MPGFRGLTLLSCLILAVPCQGATPDSIGYTRLLDELGAEAPTGAGIHVAIVEADVSPTGISYIPNPVDPQFQNPNKLFHYESTIADISAHATNVGWRYFGNSSIAPGIVDVDVYFADTWTTEDYLHNGTRDLPEQTAARVFNHSWIDHTITSEFLARIDYTVETYGAIHVVGVNNAGNVGPAGGLASAYNVISVGRTDGGHEIGSVPTSGPSALNAFYKTGARVKPDLVAPEPFTSYSTPFVSAAASLLLEAAVTHPELSLPPLGAVASAGSSGLPHAERPETIKAILMAGADRLAIPGYRSGDYASGNGLDVRFGAGELDIYQSYHILAAGERNSRETGGDYLDAAGPESTNTYQFTTGSLAESLSAAVVWNLDVSINGRQISAALPNFDVSLTKLGAAGNEEVVWLSDDLTENTENIWLPTLDPNSFYELAVFQSGSAASISAPWGVAVAWNRQPAELMPGDVNGDYTVDLADFNIIKSNFGQPGEREDGDLTGDGEIGLEDFTILKSQFGQTYASLRSGSTATSAVPEPTTWILLASAWPALIGLGIRTGKLRFFQRPNRMV